jgi:hypothetical protein
MQYVHIAVSPDSRKAWITLQESNAFAMINIRRTKVLEVVPLGFKDHSQPANQLDASNQDNAINIQNWPVHGMSQPDAIAAYTVHGDDDHASVFQLS